MSVCLAVGNLVNLRVCLSTYLHQPLVSDCKSDFIGPDTEPENPVYYFYSFLCLAILISPTGSPIAGLPSVYGMLLDVAPKS
jgi:hypothetical protein